MPTPLEFDRRKAEMGDYESLWVNKIAQAEARVNEAESKSPAQAQTEYNALIEVRRQYYDFLIQNNLTEKAKELLASHPEIERQDLAAA